MKLGIADLWTETVSSSLAVGGGTRRIREDETGGSGHFRELWAELQGQKA